MYIRFNNSKNCKGYNWKPLLITVLNSQIKYDCSVENNHYTHNYGQDHNYGGIFYLLVQLPIARKKIIG